MLCFRNKTNPNLRFPQDQCFALKLAKPNKRGFWLITNCFMRKSVINVIITLRGMTLMLWFRNKTNPNLRFPQAQCFALKLAKPNKRGFWFITNCFLRKSVINVIITLRGMTLMLWFRNKTNPNLRFPQDQRFASKLAKPNKRSFRLIRICLLTKLIIKRIVAHRGMTLMLWFLNKTNSNLRFPQDQCFAPKLAKPNKRSFRLITICLLTKPITKRIVAHQGMT